MQEVQEGPDLADAGDAVGDGQREGHLGATRRNAAQKVGVHVPQARDQELVPRVDDAGALRDASAGGGRHLDDAPASYTHYLVAEEPSFDDVDDRHIIEGHIVRASGRRAEHQSESE